MGCVMPPIRIADAAKEMVIPIRFESRHACPICVGDDIDLLCEIPFKNRVLADFLAVFYQQRIPRETLESENYRIVQCHQCEFIFQERILNTAGMVALYESWVDQTESLNKKRFASARLFRQYAGQLQVLQPLFASQPHRTRILEYGMGWGFWSRMAQAFGFDVSGFELSPIRSEHARNMGIKVVDRIGGEGILYDCIFANQVFEHLPDPLGTLVELRKNLSSDGFIYVRVPDGRGIARRLREHGWSSDMEAVHPLEHINCFTRRTLIRLAREAGLEPFNPPLRLQWGRVWGGLRREFNDRFRTTHVFFR